MRVRMRTIYAGPRGNCAAGGVIDVPVEEAEGLLAGGYADAIEPADGQGASTGKPSTRRPESDATLMTAPPPADGQPAPAETGPPEDDGDGEGGGPDAEPTPAARPRRRRR